MPGLLTLSSCSLNNKIRLYCLSHLLDRFILFRVKGRKITAVKLITPESFIVMCQINILGVSVSTYIDDPWAVGANEPGGALAQEPVFYPHHVLLGYSFGDAHHQRHLCINSLDDGRCSEWRGYINDGGICPCALLCLKREKWYMLHKK